MPKTQLWYIRRDEQVRGPYHAGLLRRYVLLGRLTPEDEASRDREEWITIARLPDLMPSELQQLDMDDPLSLERLLAAKRWADERYGPDRRAADPSAVPREVLACRRSGDRRAAEPEPEVRYRVAKAQRPRPARYPRRNIIGALVALLLAAVFIGLTVTAPRPKVAKNAECAAAPRPRIDWSYCRLNGMQLSGSDLRGANLSSTELSAADLTGSRLTRANLAFSKLSMAHLNHARLRGARLTGADLSRADLSGADLNHADLSYADLRGADLSGASLAGALLSHAIWTDGHTCAPGAVGTCTQATDGR